jgi:hypothetical protein
MCQQACTIKGAEAGSKVLGCAYAPQRSIHKDAHCVCVCVCVCFMIAPVSMTRCMINQRKESSGLFRVSCDSYVGRRDAPLPPCCGW